MRQEHRIVKLKSKPKQELQRRNTMKKLKLFRTIGSLSVAGMVLAGVAAVAFAVSSPQAAQAGNITVPPLPAGLAPVPAGNKVFLVGHATGTQNYVCLPSGSGFAWTLFTPEATLFREDGGQIITHFFSPNPIERSEEHTSELQSPTNLV